MFHAYRPARLHARLHAPRGFSMIELLVVIGIIVVLLGILIPSLNAARQSAQSVTCLANLRQLGVALTTYTANWDGYVLPSYASATTMATGNDKADRDNYATMLVNLKLIPKPQEPRSMTDTTSNGQSTFRCPAGRDEDPFQFSQNPGTQPLPSNRRDNSNNKAWRTKSESSGVIVDTWYGQNSTIREFDRYKTPFRRIPPSEAATDLRLVRSSRIYDQARMVMLFDGVFFNMHHDGDRVSARHKGKTLTNILFFDGHAASHLTEGLMGGLGPNASSYDVYADAAEFRKHPELHWRLDHR